MGNMSYCRFENTAGDMEDCIDALNEGDWNISQMMENASSKHEARAMRRFINLCRDVADNLNDEDFEE